MISLDGLHPDLMRPRVAALLADPEAKKRGVFIVSAFRSLEHQKRLFDAAVRKYGSAAAARKWVAPPGRSNHGPKVDGYGIAVDFGIPGVHANSKGQWPQDVNDWFAALAKRHGLYQRMPWEDWHYEPIEGWKPPEEDDMTPEQEAKLEAALLHATAAHETALRIEDTLTKPLQPLVEAGVKKAEATPRHAWFYAAKKALGL